MSTIACYGRKLQSITHPNTRSGRPSRPFGEGLDKPRPTILTIKGTRYEATPFQGDDSTAGVRLVKLAGKGEIWDVSRGPDGLVACDCPSYVKTYEGTSATCKHGTACVEAGLIASPAPVANPVNRVGHLIPANRPAVAKVEPIAHPLPEPEPVAEVAPVASNSRPWSEADWRRAEYFRLQAPAGMNRPVAIAVGANLPQQDPAPLANIPDGARAVQVLAGPSQGRWIKRDLEDGFVWYRGEGLALADLMSAGEADHLFHQSRLLVIPAPIVPGLDAVWHSAFCLGVAGIDALPCRDWTDAARLAFLDGLFWGAEQRSADHEDDSDRYTDSTEASWPVESGRV